MMEPELVVGTGRFLVRPATPSLRYESPSKVKFLGLNEGKLMLKLAAEISTKLEDKNATRKAYDERERTFLGDGFMEN